MVPKEASIAGLQRVAEAAARQHFVKHTADSSSAVKNRGISRQRSFVGAQIGAKRCKSSGHSAFIFACVHKRPFSCDAVRRNECLLLGVFLAFASENCFCKSVIPNCKPLARLG